MGGLISDYVGWRFAFLSAFPFFDWRQAKADGGSFTVQLPFLCLAVVPLFTFVRYQVPGQGKTKREMLRRLDYGGALSLIIVVRARPTVFVACFANSSSQLGSLLLGLSYKNNDNIPFADVRVWAPLGICAVFSVVFVLVEAFHATEPVMPLRSGFFPSKCGAGN